MRYLMGIDNGGTFSKAALFDEDGYADFCGKCADCYTYSQVGLYRKRYG